MTPSTRSVSTRAPPPARLIVRASSTSSAHYGLTVDGLIGKQTLSALQRELDVRRKSKQGGAGAAGGAAVAGGNEAVAPDPSVEPGIVGDPWITAGGIVVTVIAILFLAYLAWHYRDLIAARIQGFAPRLAGWLRSF